MWPLATEVVDPAARLAENLRDLGTLRYLAALSLTANGLLFALLMRLQAARLRDLKEGNARHERLGRLMEQHLQAVSDLERIASALQGKRRRAPPVEPKEEDEG